MREECFAALLPTNLQRLSKPTLRSPGPALRKLIPSGRKETATRTLNSMMRDGEGGGHLNSTEVELVTADVKSKMLKGSLEDADTQNVEVGE